MSAPLSYILEGRVLDSVASAPKLSAAGIGGQSDSLRAHSEFEATRQTAKSQTAEVDKPVNRYGR